MRWGKQAESHLSLQIHVLSTLSNRKEPGFKPWLPLAKHGLTAYLGLLTVRMEGKVRILTILVQTGKLRQDAVLEVT